METIETTKHGVIFNADHQLKFENAKKEEGIYEYGRGNACEIIRSFLIGSLGSDHPLIADQALAKDFYLNVRCAILHDAQTANGWIIWRNNSESPVETAGDMKVINWISMKRSLKNKIRALGKSMVGCEESRKAFRRKFDALCK